MRLIARLLLCLILALGSLRATYYLLYAWQSFHSLRDSFFLESAMVHLAWRVREGVLLYPSWDHYPYVANFYAPFYFVVVGLIGRALGTGYEGLYMVGRALTFASALSTTVLLGLVIYRRYGAGPAGFGMVLSLGVGPLFGFGTMVRPDTLAELLGVAGFFLIGARRSAWAAAGGTLLALAVMTKQTAAIYTLAAAIGLYWEGRARRAITVLAAVLAAVTSTSLAVRYSLEPNFLACLLGEARTPSTFTAWWQTIRQIARVDPELFVLTLVGIALWTSGPRREWMLIVLAALLLASGLVTSAKRGSDTNYFLGLRSVAALAAGALWQATWTRGARPRGWQVLAAAATAGGLFLSTLHAQGHLAIAWRNALGRSTPFGWMAEQFYRELFLAAQDPNRRLLTDVGCIDIRQGERTLYADPYRFKIMVEEGQVDPREVLERIDNGYYDLIITKRDLFSATYADDTFGLPKSLADRARLRYEPNGANFDLFLYRRRAPGRPRVGRQVP